MSKQSIYHIFISTGIVILNILIGHFFAPNGLFLLPAVLISIAVILSLLNFNLSPVLKSLLLTTLIIFQDLGLKLYSGGRHDHEGLGWLHLMLFTGLIPAFIILIVGVFKDTKSTSLIKCIAIALFPIIITLYLLLFNDIGLGRYYWYEWNG